MKICFIAHGNFTHITPYLNHFIARGHEVVFVRLADGPNLKGVMVFDAFKGFSSLFPGKISYLFASLRARYFIKRYSPDVINAHFATSGGVAAFLSGFQPYVVTVHGTDIFGYYRKRIWRFVLAGVLKRASRVVVVSDQLAKISNELVGSDDKVCVVSVGIDTTKFINSPKAHHKIGEPLRLISTRRMEPVYDPGCIIDALEILVNKGMNIEMTFVGGGPVKEQMEIKAEMQGVRKYTHFLGQVSNSMLPNILANHHVYLSASKWDGTSLSLLEAMAAGLFPIVSDIDANRAWIENGKSGLFFNVSEPESLACSIEYFLTSSDSFDYQETNRALVCENGDSQRNMLEFENILKCVVKNHE